MLDGHHRLAAAKAAGLDDIPSKILTDSEFAQEAKKMERFSNKEALYRIAKNLSNTLDELPPELLPKY